MKKNLLLALCTLLVSLSSCKSDSTGIDRDKYYVNVAEEEITLLRGESKQVSATTNYSKKEISFVSTDDKIASVNNDGLVTGIKIGSCSLFAYVDVNDDAIFRKEEDLYKEIKVSVTVDPKISLQKSVKLYVGDTIPKKEDLPQGEVLDYNINDVLISKDLTIYNINVEGDVPYVDVKDIPMIAKYITYPNFDELYSELPAEAKKDFDNSLILSEVEANSLFKFELFNQNVTSLTVPYEKSYAPLYIDIKNSKVYTNSYSKYMSYINNSWNNGLPNDYASIGGIVSESELTKYLTEPEKQVTFDFAKYEIYFYNISGKSYVPLNTIAPFISETTSFYYNGNDAIINLGALSRAATYYFYSSEDAILHPQDNYDSRLIKNSSLSTDGKVAYTDSSLLQQDKDVNVYLNTILLFDTTNKKYAYRQLLATQKNNFTLDSLFSSAPTGNNIEIISSYQGKYEEDENNIKLMKADGDSYSLDFFVSKRKSNFGKNLFGNNVKTFNINYLLFYLDTFYGLKDYRNIDSFEEYFKEEIEYIYLGDRMNKKADTIYNHLVNATTPNQYAYILQHIFSKVLGDVHSGMNHSTPLCTINEVETSMVDSSTRAYKIMSDYHKYKLLRMETLGETIQQVQTATGLKNVESGLYFEDETAIIQFDSFNGDIQTAEDLSEADEQFNMVLSHMDTNPEFYYSSIVEDDSFYAVLFAFKLISQMSNIKNIVFDITLNGGGMVLVVPQLLAFMTNDPVMHERDTIEKSIIEYHYKVDLDGNGIGGESSDTYKGKYNFYVLTSDYSFSCGSLFPSSCKSLGCAKIIGLKSGGGACPVSYGSDTVGSLFQISGPSQTMYKHNNSYICNDSGVEVDYELDSSYWYNHSKLNTFLKGLHN